MYLLAVATAGMLHAGLCLGRATAPEARLLQLRLLLQPLRLLQLLWQLLLLRLMPLVLLQWPPPPSEAWCPALAAPP
jgi:hypothetical protein